MPEELVTPQSLALSLAAPRAPPFGSKHRDLLCGKDPRASFLTHHHELDHDIHVHTRQQSQRATVQSHHGVHHRLQKMLESAHLKFKMPHPHLSFAPDSGDQVTRCIGSTLPIWWQHKSRDNGRFRSISDGIITATAPSLTLANPDAARRFLKLTTDVFTFRYGKHKSQFVDMFLPSDGKRRGFVFFVHGGAWGSGMPWMYRLCASPFLEAGLAVAIVGYRTYPDGNVQDQVDDLESAAKAIAAKFPHLVQKPRGQNDNDWLGLTLMGHSSGAHISMLMAVERIEKCVENNQDHHDIDTISFDYFVGLSGVYSISHHFDYEAGRAVEELSPMKPACGFTRDSFDHFSPAMRLKSLLYKKLQGRNVDEIVNKLMPDTLLIHGVHDSTVPFTSTSEAGNILRSCGVRVCQEYYMTCGHPDVVMELMLGGKTKEIVMDWLTHCRSSSTIIVDNLPSKL